MGKAKRTKQREAPVKKTGGISPTLIARAKTLVKELLPVIAIVFVTRTMLAEAYRIPSGSMEPTLLVGDWLFVNKLRYGPNIPLTDRALPGYAKPKRGDVVVFVSPPQDPAIRITPDDITPVLVKRLVGMPGDTILMRGGLLSVNEIRDTRAEKSTLPPSSASDEPQRLFVWQHQIEVSGSRFGAPIPQPSLHEWGPLVVPAGTFFMMGDNRDDSIDSRYYGVVPRANFRGTPAFVYYSYDSEEGLPYVRALTEIRWRRLGSWIR
jgi:signal peptidase I